MTGLRSSVDLKVLPTISVCVLVIRRRILVRFFALLSDFENSTLLCFALLCLTLGDFSLDTTIFEEFKKIFTF